MKRITVFSIILIVAWTHSFADTKHQPYKGLEKRDITSLSHQDVQELQNGGGWGLALPAELNGYPGPAHVLELRDKLGLSAAQVTKIQTIYNGMKSDAQEQGAVLIGAERALDHGFKAGGLTVSELQTLVTQAEAARAALRFAHLSRHLITIEVLTREQIALYSELRGYTSDPCQSVPEGHNESMWRKHNGCETE